MELVYFSVVSISGSLRSTQYWRSFTFISYGLLINAKD